MRLWRIDLITVTAIPTGTLAFMFSTLFVGLFVFRPQHVEFRGEMKQLGAFSFNASDWTHFSP